MPTLEPLLSPRSIAVVGATEREDSYGGNVLRNLIRAGYDGDVWGVNPGRERVFDWPCVPSLGDLNGPVDALVIAIPAAEVPAVVRAGGALGCGGAIVLSAGFGEVESGRALEDDLRAAAAEHSLPLCGPNGNGIVAVPARAAIWGDGLPDLRPGGVAMVTQSGNVGVNALGSRRGIGWHTVVSTGNQAVCDASDWLEAIAGLDGVRSVALFLESDGDGSALASALAACAEREIGVAVLKVGASEAGARAASAHTGALAGDQRIFRALVEEAGGAWAEDIHDLLELAKALAQPRRPRAGGLAVLTCSGGDSGVAGDEAERIGLGLPALSPATEEKLAGLLPEAATIGNPLDYTAMIWGETERLAEIIETVGADDAIARLLLLFDQPVDADPSWDAVRAGLITGAQRSHADALVASTLPDLLDEEAAFAFAEAGLPAVAGLRTALLCARALAGPGGSAGRLREIATQASGARHEASGEWLGEVSAKRLLRDAGIEVPEGAGASDADTAVAVAEAVGYPVVLKLSGAEVQHKSDVGGVVLGIEDEPALRAAVERIPKPDGTDLLVERMVDPGVELVVAATAEGVVPALVIGLGGIWTEALDDVIVIPLPASPDRIAAELKRLRGYPLLSGGRGGEAADLTAIATLASNLGRQLCNAGLALIEANPVIATASGAVAADAVARR